MSAIVCNEINKSFGATPVLDDLDVSIHGCRRLQVLDLRPLDQIVASQGDVVRSVRLLRGGDGNDLRELRQVRILLIRERSRVAAAESRFFRAQKS